MNKENYNRPIGGGLGQIHLDGEGWQVHAPCIPNDVFIDISNCRLIVKELNGQFLVTMEDIGGETRSFYAPGLLLDLALAIVKKARKDGIDVDRW